MFAPLDDHDLFPLLDDAGRAMLKRLREHPSAPTYNWRTGERLTAMGLANVRAYADRLRTDRQGWRHNEAPPWLQTFVQHCRQDVPFHRDRADWSDDFLALPPMTRDTIRDQPWALVPDSLPLDDLIVYTTSGTVGQRLRIISHPEVPARYLPAFQLALARVGVTLDGGPDRVSIVHVCAQQSTNVMSSVSSYLGGAGFAKVNLLPHDWRDPRDPARFIDDCNPEIYTGDPFAFAQLMKLPLRTRPKAILSSATALLPGMRAALRDHFACPVIDLYSMNESGPIAFAATDDRHHEVLPHDLYVEILDPAGHPCPPGVRGEVALTGGNNPFLPLLRYRTGDFAAIDYSHAIPRLVGLQGGAPIIFRTSAGRPLNAIDVTLKLKDLPLPRFALHQRATGELDFSTPNDDATTQAAGNLLRELFGPDIAITTHTAAPAGKPINYTSDYTSDIAG